VISLEFGPALPEAEYEVFPRPPLKAMLGQVRFPTILRIADLGALGGFQDAIREEWPQFAQEQQLGVLVGPQGLQEASSTRAFRFTSQGGTWSALLTPDALTLEAGLASGAYTSYDEFRERFAHVWTALVEHFRPAGMVQQGLRYVDHIERQLAPADWATLINPELLGPLTKSFSTGVAHAVSDLRFQREDGLLAFKHGLIPAGPTNAFGYLLDFDYFTQAQDEDTSVDTIMTRFDRYHEVIYAFFRWCVTEQALEEFRRAAE
jgi:uncharacterized protein (TIGR04255 family)